MAIFGVPCPTVEIENSREGTGALRLIHTRHQHSACAVAPELDLADRDVEFAGGVVRRTRQNSGSKRKPGGASGRQFHEEVATAKGCRHADLLAKVTIFPIQHGSKAV